MGRKPLNITKEQKRERHNEQRMRSYWKHAVRERANNLTRYHTKKDRDIRIEK